MLLNLLTKLVKKSSAVHGISVFCNLFNKLNTTGVRMSDSIYHKTFNNLIHVALNKILTA